MRTVLPLRGRSGGCIAAFNPRDEWLRAGQRSAIAAVIAESAVAIDTQAREFETVAQRELAASRARGLATAIDLIRWNGDLQIAPLGPQPILREVDGTLFGLRREDAPETTQARQRLQQLGATLVSRLADAFAACGTITVDEQRCVIALANDIANVSPPR